MLPLLPEPPELLWSRFDELPPEPLDDPDDSDDSDDSDKPAA